MDRGWNLCSVPLLNLSDLVIVPYSLTCLTSCLITSYWGEFLSIPSLWFFLGSILYILESFFRPIYSKWIMYFQPCRHYLVLNLTMNSASTREPSSSCASPSHVWVCSTQLCWWGFEPKGVYRLTQDFFHHCQWYWAFSLSKECGIQGWRRKCYHLPLILRDAN